LDYFLSKGRHHWLVGQSKVNAQKGLDELPGAHEPDPPHRGLRNIGTIGGEPNRWIEPSASNPCRSYNGTLRGLVASR
jgi:hypothetical protein